VKVKDSAVSTLSRVRPTRRLNLYLFRSLDEVRVISYRCIEGYNDLCPHDALGGLLPAAYANINAEPSF
jgi:hypothetical protein